MLALRELQQQFATALYDAESTAVQGCIEAGGITAPQRLQIYRNNLRTTLTEALAATYPVVRRLVGDDFFERCAHHYITLEPSRSGNVSDYGARFAGCLQQFPPAQALPYLPDVARLEWARHEAAKHPCAAPFPLARLASIAPEYWGTLHLYLHPSSQLVTSDYPILAIWLANQEAAVNSTVALTPTQEFLLIVRHVDDVQILRLTASEHAFLEQCRIGAPFDAACAAALDQHADLDVTALLSRFIAERIIVDFSPPLEQPA